MVAFSLVSLAINYVQLQNGTFTNWNSWTALAFSLFNCLITQLYINFLRNHLYLESELNGKVCSDAMELTPDGSNATVTQAKDNCEIQGEFLLAFLLFVKVMFKMSLEVLVMQKKEICKSLLIFENNLGTSAYFF